ncbi:MAG: hypothetical protein IIX54_05940, partial [Clostridia bacterium]|nr:hypothetical protein [Clostridia bacterium]
GLGPAVFVGDGEIPLIGEMSEGQKGLGKAVPSTSRPKGPSAKGLGPREWCAYGTKNKCVADTIFILYSFFFIIYYLFSLLRKPYSSLFPTMKPLD